MPRGGKRPPRVEYEVPVTVAEEYTVTVLARSEREAVERVNAGRYKTLGRGRNRGFLIVGKATRKDPDQR